MNKNEKFLRKLLKEDRDRIKLAVALIHSNNFQILDFKKLSGSQNMYRVRIGRFRIKFYVHSDHNEIIEIVRRNDNTY
jgi:mRNA-degrading endonuclease RelE of RelBE toxin-antitoxin system